MFVESISAFTVEKLAKPKKAKSNEAPPVVVQAPPGASPSNIMIQPGASPSYIMLANQPGHPVAQPPAFQNQMTLQPTPNFPNQMTPGQNGGYTPAQFTGQPNMFQPPPTG